MKWTEETQERLRALIAKGTGMSRMWQQIAEIIAQSERAAPHDLGAHHASAREAHQQRFNKLPDNEHAPHDFQTWVHPLDYDDGMG